MDRTGILPGKAFDLFRLIFELPGLVPRGLHVYDGHIHDEDIQQRKETVEKAYAPVSKLIDALNLNELPVP